MDSSAGKRLKLNNEQGDFVVVGKEEVLRVEFPHGFSKMVKRALKSIRHADPADLESHLGQNVFQFTVLSNGIQFQAVASVPDRTIIYFNPQAQEVVQHPVPASVFGNEKYVPYVFALPVHHEPWIITAFVAILRHPIFEGWYLIHLLNYVASLSKKYKSVRVFMDGSQDNIEESQRKQLKQEFKKLLLNFATIVGIPYTSIMVDDASGNLMTHDKPLLPRMPSQMFYSQVMKHINPERDLQTQKHREFRTISPRVAGMVPRVKRVGTHVIYLLSSTYARESIPDEVKMINKAYRVRVSSIVLDDDNEPIPKVLANVKRLNEVPLMNAIRHVGSLEIVGDYMAEKNFVQWLTEVLGAPDCSIHELKLFQHDGQGSWNVLVNVLHSGEYRKVYQGLVEAIARNTSLTKVILTSIRMCQQPFLEGLAMRHAADVLKKFSVDDSNEADGYDDEGEIATWSVLPSDIIPILRKNWNSLAEVYLTMNDKEGALAKIGQEFLQKNPTSFFHLNDMADE
jgi:hypothetical protein